MTQMNKCLFNLMANTTKFQLLLLLPPTPRIREAPNQMLCDLKVLFQRKKLLLYLNIIKMEVAGRGKRYLHVNSLK